MTNLRQAKSSPTIVVKIGGSTLGSHDTTLEDLVALQREGTLPVVVHGGGRTISEWLERHGLATRFIRGLRVTDAEGLKVVMAVLTGLVNKELVCAIHSLGGRAVGLSGADGCLIEARIRDPELGFVGEIVRVNLEPLQAIIGAGYIPVIAPLGVERGGAGVCQPLNINADTVAGEIALKLRAQRLVFLTDVVGLCDASGRLIPRLSPQEARSLIASGVVSGGMIPKVEACLSALGSVPATQIVDGRVGHALIAALRGKDEGTVIEGGRVVFQPG